MLRALGWTGATRTSDGRSQCGRGDIQGGPGGFVIEVKRVERLDVPGALRRLAVDAGDDAPLLVHRASRQPWLATLGFGELLELLADIERKEN